MPHSILRLAILAAGFSAMVAAGEAVAVPAKPPTRADVTALMDEATTWILAQQQADGSFTDAAQFKLGITELCAQSLVQAGMKANDPPIVKALAFVIGFRQKDGGIYDPSSGLGNYCTALGLQLLVAVGCQDKALIEGAQKYLIGLQNTDEKSVSHGGIGYGIRGKGNEDLSNTSMAIEALRKSGMPETDPAMQRALKFVQRCQNLSGSNDLEWAGPDGGGVYSPDTSKAEGSYHDGGKPSDKPPADGARAKQLPSYGSMTYALLSSYIYLNLKADDPRVKAAMDWASRNYQFDANPGMPEAKAREGLFYFYRLMAKTYNLTKTGTVDRGEKGAADWRADLLKALQERKVKPKEGKGALWLNSADRWAEGSPNLVTAYVLGTLAMVRDSLPE